MQRCRRAEVQRYRGTEAKRCRVAEVLGKDNMEVKLHKWRCCNAEDVPCRYKAGADAKVHVQGVGGR